VWRNKTAIIDFVQQMISPSYNDKIQEFFEFVKPVFRVESTETAVPGQS